jgi:hypothetical protein
MTWGLESNVIQRFGMAGIFADRVSVARDTYTFRLASTPSEFVMAVPTVLGTDGERIRSGRKERP